MMWGMGSRIGVAIAPSAKAETSPGGGPKASLGSGNANGLLLQFAGQNFGFSASASTLKLDIEPVFGGGTTTFKSTQIGLAAMAGKSISLGLGVETREQTNESSGGSNTDKRSGPLAGAVWRLGDTFYIGGTYGSQKTDRTAGPSTDSGDRTIGRVGLGFFWQKAGSGFHLEAFHEADNLLDASNNITQTSGLIEKGTTNGATLEALMSNFLFGITASKNTSDVFDATAVPTLDTVEDSVRTVSLGWVREKGFVVAVNVSHREIKSQISQNLYTIDAAAVAIGAKF
jgi:hypothetical protein